MVPPAVALLYLAVGMQDPFSAASLAVDSDSAAAAVCSVCLCCASNDAVLGSAVVDAAVLAPELAEAVVPGVVR